MLLVPFQWVLCRYILFAKIRKNSKQSKCVTRDRPHLSKEEGIFAYEQLAGKPGSADEKTRAFFLVATGECIFQIWVVLMASIYSCVFCPFSMMRNQGFDEVKGPKNLGRHQRTIAHGERPSAMSAVARAPSPVNGGRSRTRWAMLTPLAVIAGLPSFKGVPEGRGIKDPRSPERQDGLPIISAEPSKS